MKKIFYIALLILTCTIPVPSSAYTLTTTNVTNCIHNSGFNTMDDWYTSTPSEVSIVNCLGETGVLLKSNYCNTTNSVLVGIQTYSDISTYEPINLLNSNKTEIVHDALILKIQYMASTPACWSESSSYISGNLCVFLQGGLSCTAVTKPEPPLLVDTRIFELGGFNVSTSQPIYCKATSWTDMCLTFIPPEESDWWQIRNIYLGYEGMPNQPNKSGIVINKIELYAIRVDEN